MSDESAKFDISKAIRRWQKKRGALIMMLHAVQESCGYVPRELARELADATDVPLARIYEVITFYNYFKLKSPGKVVVSMCTGTACHLKGAPDVLAAFEDELGIRDGETTDDGNFHVQCVRCVGCCGLAPAVVINGRTYGKVKPPQVRAIVARWQEKLVEEEAKGLANVAEYA
jgi:NADH-quinone oxidoreductase subunit E